MEDINRREILKKASNGIVVVFGALIGMGILAMALLAAEPPATLKDRDWEAWLDIQSLKWQTENPETLTKLKDYIHDAYPDKIRFAAAAALALRTNPVVLPMLQIAYRYSVFGKSGNTSVEQLHEISNARIQVAKMLVMHYAAYSPAREDVIAVLVKKLPNFLRSKVVIWNAWSHWQSLSGAQFIGNQALRELIIQLQKARSTGHDGSEIDLRKMLQPIIVGFFPEFPLTPAIGSRDWSDWMARMQGGYRCPRSNWQEVTPEDIAKAKKEIFINGVNDGILIKFVHQLLEDSQFTREASYRDRLLELLRGDKRGDTLKQTIIAAFGNEPVLHDDVQNMLLQFVATGTNTLAVASAKALRWKENIPLDPLLTRWKHSGDEIKIELESAISTIRDPRVFPILVDALCSCNPAYRNHETVLSRRIDNLKLWYVLLGAGRDKIMAAVLKKYTVSEQETILAWLRDTTTFSFLNPTPYVSKGWFFRMGDENDNLSKMLPSEVRNIFGLPLEPTSVSPVSPGLGNR